LACSAIIVLAAGWHYSCILRDISNGVDIRSNDVRRCIGFCVLSMALAMYLSTGRQPFNGFDAVGGRASGDLQRL